MGGKDMHITVYHGGTNKITSPLSGAGRDNLDFGKGFYITDIRQQAVDWAHRTADRRHLAPMLNVYELDRVSILANYRCKVFHAYNEEWLDFIVASRLGKRPWLAYDYIEGGVADDRVVDTINLYMADLMSKDKALERLSVHQPNNQMCLLLQDIIDKHLLYYGTERL